jgi:hypothetical protein
MYLDSEVLRGSPTKLIRNVVPHAKKTQLDSFGGIVKSCKMDLVLP